MASERCGRTRGLLLLLVGGLHVLSAGGGLARAQELDQPGESAGVTEPADPPLDGFWPTERLTEYALHRWCGQVTDQYQLDAEQAAQLERMMFRRWPRWMKDNRSQLQPLFNEFMENRLAPQPPSAEQVSDWAGRALRMFDSGRRELDAAQADFRQWLSPTQKMRFDADVTKVNVGMELFEQKLRTWQEGRYVRDELWKQPYWERRREREAAPDAEQRQAADAAQAESAPARPDAESEVVPLDKWESYVVTFVRKYSLDAEQTTSAWTIMGDLRARADRYRDRHSAEYARIEDKLAESDTEAREPLVARREALDEPLARLFEELKTRLERLLTEAQRRAVEGAPQATAEPAASNS